MKTVNYALMVLTLLLSACVTTGYISLQDAPRDLITKHLTQGKTSKHKVIECFGHATRITTDDSGNEVWIYQNKMLSFPFATFPASDSSGTGSNQPIRELLISFDQHGVVSQYSIK